MACRLLEARKLGDDSWYLSTNKEDGSVIYVWRAHSGLGGLIYGANMMLKVGCRPVGSLNLAE